MAEPRRVQLSSLPVVALTPLDLKKTPSSDVSDEVVEAEPAEAIRITLTLFEPDHKRCPEFFYPELVRNPHWKGKTLPAGMKKKEPLNLFNDDEIEKRDAEALAKQFEEKYGSKKRRRDRAQDLIDMGYGYDDTDSFIDNSEAYDELVPASLSTKYGGFYINSGTLQFRQASESEDDFTKEKKKKSPKKRKMKDGDENLKKKRKEDLHEKEKTSKKSKYPKAEFTALNGIKEKKKKKYSLSVDDMLRKFCKEKESQKKEDEQTVTSSSSSLQVVMPVQREAESMSDPLLSLFGSATASDLLQAANAMETLSDLDLERLLNDSPDSSPFPDVEDGSEPSLGASPEPSVKPPPSIPEGLPETLEKRITELTQAARAADGDPKHKFFTKEINTILLDIELQSRKLNGPQRSSVYSHLALFLPFSKETLLKRARKLHRHEQGGQLKEPLQKLKDAICKSMPQQVGKYHEECQAHTQAKFAKMLEDEKDKEQRDRVCSDEDDDDDKAGKRVMGPRKKFQWNEEIRELLSHVVKIKVECFQLGKNKSLGLEDYLKAFLDAEVKPLWPKGWMQARTLFKESRRVSTYPTLMMARRKVMMVAKIKGSTCKPVKKSLLPGLLSGTAGSASSEQMGLSYVPGKVTRDVSHSTALPTVCVLSSTPCGMDRPSDGDLIVKPPLLEGVSAELARLKARAGSVSDVPYTSASKVSLEKVSTTTTSEEKINSPRPILSPLPSGSLQQSLGFISEHTVVVGQVSHEKKMERTNYKGLCNPVPASKILPVTHQDKQRHHHSLQKSTFPGPQVPIQSSTTQPIKLFHLNSQQQKTFSLPANVNKPQISKSPSSSLMLSTRPVFQTPKSLAKPQSFHSMVTSSSSSGGGTQISSSTHKAPSLSYAGKHSVSSSTSSQAFRSSFLPSSKHVTTTSTSAPGSSIAQSFVSGSSLAVSQSTSPGLASSHPIPSALVKKSVPSQKLTLVSPPGGSKVDAGGGNQGVAKLLTSSATTVMANSISSSTPVMCTSGTTFLTASSSISVLAPTFKSTKLPGSLSSNALGILSPIHAFPLHVISFNPDTVAKVGVSSKDAIVTGPAPGTFHHGLHNDAQNHGKGPNGQQRKL